MTTLFYFTNSGKTAHVIDPEDTRHSYCGRVVTKRGHRSEIRPATHRPCHSCYVASMRRLIFPFESDYEVTPDVVARSMRIDARLVVEVPESRVFTVEGTSGLYLVTLASGLNPVCTCLAGKTKPAAMCKHVAKVLAIVSGLTKAKKPRAKRTA